MGQSSLQNLKQLSDSVSEKYKNIVVSEVNDACLRLAVFDGVYDWHHHPDSEELVIVLEGELRIEFENENAVTLRCGDTYTVPAGKIHRTIAKGRTVNLCFELTEAKTEFVRGPDPAGS
jgi:mannose-6-phosphate isomerase-like protein (cupin superfamily)